MRITLCIALYITTVLIHASSHTHFRGFVTDTSGKRIPYATISVPARHAGSLADSTGRFDFRLTGISSSDTVMVSSIGYIPVHLTVTNLRSMGDSATISLQANPHSLQSVEVTAPKVKAKTFGRTGMGGFFEVQVGSGHPEGTGIGVRCKVGKRAWIKSVSMGWIQRENSVERMPFRLNIYNKKNGEWTNVSEREIIFTYRKEELDDNGRFTYTLPEPLMITGDTMVEFEFLEPFHGRVIDIKSTVMAGCFNFHSFGKWESIPTAGSFAVHALVEK